MNRLFFCVVFALLAASVLAYDPQYSYSPFRGSTVGTETTLKGKGPITGVRLWSGYNSFIFGIQLRFGPCWSRLIGRPLTALNELQLFEDETIVQVSGKYGRFIQQLVFVTSRGRFIIAGQPTYQSFNMYPEHKDAELVFISVRVEKALTAIATHWAVVDKTSW